MEIPVLMEVIFYWEIHWKTDTLCHLILFNFIHLVPVLSPSTTEEIEV